MEEKETLITIHFLKCIRNYENSTILAKVRLSQTLDAAPGPIYLQSLICFIKISFKGFPGGAVVKNPPASAGDTGSNPGPGRSHEQLSPCTTTTEPTL